MLMNLRMNLLVHINPLPITKQLTNSLRIHWDQNSPNSLQNLMNSLVDLDLLCTSAPTAKRFHKCKLLFNYLFQLKLL